MLDLLDEVVAVEALDEVSEGVVGDGEREVGVELEPLVAGRDAAGAQPALAPGRCGAGAAAAGRTGRGGGGARGRRRGGRAADRPPGGRRGRGGRGRSAGAAARSRAWRSGPDSQRTTTGSRPGRGLCPRRSGPTPLKPRPGPSRGTRGARPRPAVADPSPRHARPARGEAFQPQFVPTRSSQPSRQPRWDRRPFPYRRPRPLPPRRSPTPRGQCLTPRRCVHSAASRCRPRGRPGPPALRRPGRPAGSAPDTSPRLPALTTGRTSSRRAGTSPAARWPGTGRGSPPLRRSDGSATRGRPRRPCQPSR